MGKIKINTKEIPNIKTSSLEEIWIKIQKRLMKFGKTSDLFKKRQQT